MMRIGGELHPLGDAPRLKPEDTLDMAFAMMSNRQKQRFKEVSEVDIGYGVTGLGRFRANIFNSAVPSALCCASFLTKPETPRSWDCRR